MSGVYGVGMESWVDKGTATEPQLWPGFPLSLLGLDNGSVLDFNISSVQSLFHWAFFPQTSYSGPHTGFVVKYLYLRSWVMAQLVAVGLLA